MRKFSIQCSSVTEWLVTFVHDHLPPGSSLCPPPERQSRFVGDWRSKLLSFSRWRAQLAKVAFLMMFWISFALALPAWAENNTTNVITVATNAGDTYIVGLLGTNNYLEIRTTGGLTNGIGVVGSAESASNNYALVTGSSARWINTNSANTNILDLGELYVGSNSPGNRLTITNGGRVSADYAYVGFGTNSVNNRVVVTSPNSRWDMISLLVVGYGGGGNQLAITNSGRVGSQNDCIIGGGFEAGFETLASNNTVVVTGSGSTLTNDGYLYVGYNSSGNQLTITNGGRATNADSSIGDTGSSNNTVLVTGVNSIWSSVGNSLVGGGLDSINNRLIVTNGGVVTGLGALIGDNNFAISNQVVVAGSNSRWLLGGDLSVGQSGPFNFLTIQNGGQVVNSNGFIGNNYTALSNLVLVSGSNSRWTNLATLYVGSEGSSNWMMISNSAQVSSYGGYIGGNTNGNGNVAFVTDAGSLWTNPRSLGIGLYTDGNSLIVSNAGKVVCGFGQVGLLGSGNQALVTGTNSQWLITGDLSELYVGQAGPSNVLWIQNGGLVTNFTGYVGAAGTNNLAVVTGAGTQWRNAELYLGSEGIVTNYISGEVTIPGGNLMIVQSNATVQAPNLYAGYGAANNQLLISSGSLVQATNVVVGFTEEATNNLLGVWGASLIVTNPGLNAQIEVRHGTLSVSNATVRTPTLLVGTNAALTGVGTVTATTITNSGVLAPGFVGGRLILNGALTLQSSSALSYELGGYTSGVTFDVLIVSNAARLGGTLAVRFVNGFEAALTNGASFTLMTGGSFSGTFANVASGSLMTTADGFARFLVTYSGTNLVLSSPDFDFDSDGMPNWWEMAHGLNPNNPNDASLHGDADGVNNLQEYLAGTDPFDPASYFHVTAVRKQTNDLAVMWTTVGGKKYVLQGTTNTTSRSFTNSFLDLSPVLTAPGVGESTTNYLDLGVLTNRVGRYYRVKLVP